MRLHKTSSSSHTLYLDSGLEVYFSYQTPIGYLHPEGGLTLSENKWGPTTSKHLKAINPDLSLRVPHELVITTLSRVMEGI